MTTNDSECGIAGCEWCDPNQHLCEPDRYPSTLTEGWVCECGKAYRAYDVHAELPARLTSHVPPGTFGWTTRKVQEA